jgi:hypothetical protein
MNRYEKEIKAIDEAMLGHVNSYKEIFDREEKEDRKLTEDERDTIQEKLKAIEVLKEEVRRRGEPEDPQDVEDIGRKLGPAIPSSMSVTSEPQDRVFQQLSQHKTSVRCSPTRPRTRARSTPTVRPADGSRRASRPVRSRSSRRARCSKVRAAAAVPSRPRCRR